MNSGNSRENFLAPETRCGYYVDSGMKAVWKVELDMLEEFIRICKKHDLQYAMCGGSLLGAVRHKGFIPWDDDIDVSMMRRDYDRFLMVAKDELKSPYFLQTTLTDPERTIGYAQIRRSDTSAIDLCLVERKPQYNFGICLDIFPVDTISSSRMMFAFQRFCIRQINRLYAYSYLRGDWGIVRKIAHYIAKGVMGVVRPSTVYRFREFVYKLARYRQGDRIGLLSWSFVRDWNFWPAECFSGYKDVPFEYLTVAIPNGAERILDITYGDWRRPVKGGAAHGGVYYDADRPYKDVLVEKFGYKPEWVKNLP